mmetsp:Transcript_116895/g.202912  ORF Transcript_116895/g.202912 Transcript_116895/m.202912 type:complete len:418 (-) Transcript_116895:21-1274(-)
MMLDDLSGSMMLDDLDFLANATSIVRGHNLTFEDKGFANDAGFLRLQSDRFWGAIVVLQVLGIFWFLSSVQLHDKREDLSMYQALPIACLWIALGIGLVLFNKLLFLPQGVGFGFPFAVFLMWWHALVGIIVTNIIRFLRPSMLPAVAEHRFSLESYFNNIFPVASLQGASLALGNSAYLYISLAYIQMVKSTTSVFVYMFSIMLALERGTYSATIAVVMVVAGLVMMSVGEMTFTLIGFVIQSSGTLCDALRLVLTKIILSSSHAVHLDPMSVLYYSAPTMCLFLTVPMLLWDFPGMLIKDVWDIKFVLLANALTAFGLNVTSMFFIKRSGPTTYALTGVVKDIALILLSCFAFGHPKKTVQLAGFVLSIAGFQLYNKLKEDQAYFEKLYCSLRFAGKAPVGEETTPLVAESVPKA